MKVPVHVDGARIFNAAVAQQVAVKDLLGETEVIRLAKRARKRVGGGMRQAGVLAAMGMYAVQHNVERLAEDHQRAKRLGHALKENGFQLLREGQIDTNIVYFGLPDDCSLSRDDFVSRLNSDYGVKVTGGYSSGGKLFRAVTHMHIDDAGIDRAIEGMVALGSS
ncbi:MAG: hypothetical protein SGARI_007581 [Bacillariaceae sp.]